jgi:hypothetical protein
MMPLLQRAGASTRPNGRGSLANGSAGRGESGDCCVCFGWGVHFSSDVPLLGDSTNLWQRFFVVAGLVGVLGPMHGK